MMKNRQFWDGVKTLWCVERHPKGGLLSSRLVDALERNHNRWEEKKEDEGWEIISLHPCMSSAQERIRELKRKIREMNAESRKR